MVLICWMFLLQLCSHVLGETLVDMSYDLAEDSAYYPTGTKFKKTELNKGYTAQGFWYEAYSLQLPEHASTHMDAPNHFAYGHQSVDEIPLSSLVAPAVVIDMSERAAQQPNAALSTDELMAWLEEYGPLPDGAVVFVRTGWGKRYGDPVQYFGTDTKDVTKFEFPGISTGAAQMLGSYEAVSGRKVVGVGIDTPSLDTGNSTTFLAHQELSKHDMYGLENVANLDKLPIVGAEVTVLPLKVRGGSGGPCRILARIPDGNKANAAPCASLLPFAVAVLCAIFFEM